MSHARGQYGKGGVSALAGVPLPRGWCTGSGPCGSMTWRGRGCKPICSWDVERDRMDSEAAVFCGHTVLPVSTDRLLVVLSAGEGQWQLCNQGVPN